MTSNIGTYGEKSMHRDVKWRLEPTGEFHEMPVGKYIADIRTEYGITEIQTRAFYKLREKLNAFLPEHPVTLVYPMAREKLIVWTDGDGGEIIRTRKSPKRGSFYDAFTELYNIKALLTDGNLRLRLMLFDVSERRTASNKSWKKYIKTETEIRSFVDEMVIERAGDYRKLIPNGLRAPFTAADFAKASGLNKRNSGIALNVLHHVGAIERIGKYGNFHLYILHGSGAPPPDNNTPDPSRSATPADNSSTDPGRDEPTSDNNTPVSGYDASATPPDNNAPVCGYDASATPSSLPKSTI